MEIIGWAAGTRKTPLVLATLIRGEPRRVIVCTTLYDTQLCCRRHRRYILSVRVPPPHSWPRLVRTYDARDVMTPVVNSLALTLGRVFSGEIRKEEKKKNKTKSRPVRDLLFSGDAAPRGSPSLPRVIYVLADRAAAVNGSGVGNGSCSRAADDSDARTRAPPHRLSTNLIRVIK